MVRIYIISILLAVALSAPSGEKMTTIPGYPSTFNTSIYSGYLDLQNANRSAHYLFVESINGPNNKEPLTLWLNGGPGCSSLLGFIQEIGPYYMQEGVNYKEGDNLTMNPYSWHTISNLLFLQSPAGVGFSYNLDTKFEYNDVQTANDNFKALLSFYTKFPEYRSRGLWLAGQSYAGKYIPDLGKLIDQYNVNRSDIINFKGIFVGNGIMSFSELSTSQVQYMVGRSFIDPQLLNYWRSSCQTDPDSAGCRYFAIKFQQNIDEINPYNVYSYCYYNDSFDSNKTKKFESQHGILNSLKKQYRERLFQQGGDKEKIKELIYTGRSTQFTQQELQSIKQNPKFNGAPCAYFDGMYNYFTINAKAYNAKFTDMKWNGPCAQNITYHIDPSGSMASYQYLLGRFSKKYSMNLYNGNWDVVVPYIDTIANIKALNLVESYIHQPWFTNNQHSGFSQLYSGLLFTTVKGASHQVPQSKRPQALNLFNLTLKGHPQLRAKQAAYKQKMEAKLE